MQIRDGHSVRERDSLLLWRCLFWFTHRQIKGDAETEIETERDQAETVLNTGNGMKAGIGARMGTRTERQA